MFTRILLSSVGLIVYAAVRESGETEPPKDVKAFVVACHDSRVKQIQRARKKAAYIQQDLKENRTARVNPNQRVVTVDAATKERTYPSEEVKHHDIQNDERRLKSLQDTLERLDKSLPMPQLILDNLHVGAVGALEFPEGMIGDRTPSFEVMQITDGTNMMVTMFGQRVWVSGVSTAGLVDGKKVELPQVFRITGTKTYKTAIGGSNTVFVFSPVDMEKMQPYLEKENKKLFRQYQERREAGARKKAAAEKARWRAAARTWTDKTGKYKVFAEAVAYRGGKVHLRKEDRSIVTVPLSKLSFEDQKILRQKIKEGLPKEPPK